MSIIIEMRLPSEIIQLTISSLQRTVLGAKCSSFFAIEECTFHKIRRFFFNHKGLALLLTQEVVNRD